MWVLYWYYNCQYIINHWEFHTLLIWIFILIIWLPIFSLPATLISIHPLQKLLKTFIFLLNNLLSPICDAHIFTEMVPCIGLRLTYTISKKLFFTPPKSSTVPCSSGSTFSPILEYWLAWPCARLLQAKNSWIQHS